VSSRLLQTLRAAPATAVVLVTAAIFVDMLVYGMVVPILPHYATALGASQAAVGLLFACYAIALLVATPFLGSLSDRIGRRGPMMLGGLFGLAAATVLFAYVAQYPGLVVARLLQGFAAAATWTAGLALLADVFPPASRGKAMGTAMGGMVAGTLVGPPVGGLLFEWGGYRLPFFVAAAVTLAIGLALALLLERLALPARSRRSMLLWLVRDRPVLVVAGAIVIHAGALTLLEPTLPLHLQQRFEASPGLIGLLFGVSTLAYGVGTPLSGVLADRWGCTGVMVLGLTSTALVLPLLALPNSLIGTGIIMALVGFASGLVLVPALPMLAARVDRLGGGAYASVYAILNIAYAIGMIAGPIVGSLVAELFNLLAALAVVALLLLIYTPLVVRERC
jgi:multidrug resistance protein